MYEKHFSFKCKPFDLVPNPDFLFLSNTHQKAITYLDYAIKEKIGFICLTGEIGSGKTTIVRNLIKNLHGSVKLSRIHNTKVSSEQLIGLINEDFGLRIEGKNKTKLLSELNGFLIEEHSRKLQPILLIDEAQNLSPDLLEEVRLLSNLETDRAKLLQIILVGQPELKKTLMLPELQQLRQRINISCHITPLTIEETAGYIKHRLVVAGNPGAIDIEDDMLYLIYQFSRGIPRLINILCDFALLTAYVEGKKQVPLTTFREVIHDLEKNDYRSESQSIPVSDDGNKQLNSDLSKITGDIALRLIQLEETVKDNVSELISLTNKVIRLEDDNSKFADVLTNSKIADIFDMLKELQKMIVHEDFENKFDRLQPSQAKHTSGLFELENKIESVTKIINHLNNKLKSLK